MRILQLSDPHLLADPAGRCRGRPSLALLRHALARALVLPEAAGKPADLLLITGDLCQDESWGGYVRLRELLDSLPLPVALLAGNHDHPQMLRAVLGRRAVLAPAVLPLGTWSLLLLDSHLPGAVGGRLGWSQLAWLEQRLGEAAGPVCLALHHPPLPIGDPEMDAIGLEDGEELLAVLRRAPAARGLVFGHVHQHWQGTLPGRPEFPLLGCPSTLAPFGPVQPCPRGRAADPGGRLLELGQGGEIRHTLLRWELPAVPSVGAGL
ncbi:metallophosphoesterase [Cyanobium sp. FGCU-6]|jgi:Icc protein|nr:metallophosphoesterase [Cyanobium sp. FGCU6]